VSKVSNSRQEKEEEELVKREDWQQVGLEMCMYAHKLTNTNSLATTAATPLTP
jgi:hypothetical protein